MPHKIFHAKNTGFRFNESVKKAIPVVKTEPKKIKRK